MRAVKFFAEQGWDINGSYRIEKDNLMIRKTRNGIYSFWEDDKCKFTANKLREFAGKYAVYFRIDIQDDSISMLSYFKYVGFKQITGTRFSFAELGIYVQKRGNMYYVRSLRTKVYISEGMRKNELKQYLKDNYNLLEEK